MAPMAVMGGLFGFGALFSAMGAYGQAKMARTQLKLQAEMGALNQRISETAARGELMRGEREQQAVRMRTTQLKSRQRVAMAASGIDLGTGTAAEVLSSTDYMGEMDANTVEANAIRAAWGYRMQGANYGANAIMARGSASAISPGMSAVSSLLGSAAYAAPTLYSMSKES